MKDDSDDRLVKELLAPAKLNLSLEIVGKRPDGYHDIRSLMIPIDLTDEIRLEIRKGGEEIECYCDDPEVPTGEGNLAFKAAKLFLERTHIERGVTIHIRKHIPIAGGLAGGSSDAAGVLKALNDALGSLLNPARLNEIGLEIGSDVPFLLGGAPAWVAGRGEKLTPADVPQGLIYLILNPGFGISTKWAYEAFDLTIPETRLKIRHSSVGGVKMVNELEIPVFDRYPKLKELKEKLVSLGAEAALMSGSGSTVFGVFSDVKEAETAGRKLAKEDRVAVFTAKLFPTR